MRSNSSMVRLWAEITSGVIMLSSVRVSSSELRDCGYPARSRVQRASLQFRHCRQPEQRYPELETGDSELRSSFSIAAVSSPTLMRPMRL